MINSPFIYGRPLRAGELIGRNSFAKRLYRGIANHSNLAITGYPHVGKTSLCNYIMDENKRQQTLEGKFGKFIFSYVDAQLLLSNSIQQPQFWEFMLQPLQGWLDISAHQEGQYTIDLITNAYTSVKNHQYSNFYLRQLFELIGQKGLGYIGIIDEFDVLLHHPGLSSEEFFGGLRSLSSTTGGLSIVIASRQRLANLNLLAQRYNTSGSPFFNTFNEIYIGALPPEEIQELLRRGEPLLEQADREFIINLAAGQPFLTQVAAKALHEAIEDELTGVSLYETVSMSILENSKVHFQDTWRHFSPRIRKSIFLTALLEFPLYLDILTPMPTWRLITTEFERQILELIPELRELVDSGLVFEEGERRYRLKQEAFIWWLADEMVKHAPTKLRLEKWLQINELDGTFSNAALEQFTAITLDIIRSMKGGALELIRTKAQGYSQPIKTVVTKANSDISVFVSHSTKDDAIANRIAGDLRSAGFNIWIDHENIPPISQWDEEIEKALDNCTVLIFLATEKSLESIECRREWNYVLNRTRRVVPLIIESGLKLPYRLHLNQWVNLTSDYNEGLQRLVSSLKNLA